MSVFALTGSFGCGKTTVLKLLQKKGALIFNADKRVHFYYRQGGPLYQRVIKEFPLALVNKKLSLQRLAQIIFNKTEERQRLERIVHPLIIRDLKKWIKKVRFGKRIGVAEIPLLFEKKLEGLFCGTILVKTKKELLLRRLRKKMPLVQIKRRLSLFLPLKEKTQRADFIIENDRGLKELERKVDLLWRELKRYKR